MKLLRDLSLTLVVVVALFTFVAALPFLIVIFVVGGVFFLVYAYIHDAQLEEVEEPENEEPLD